MTDYVYAMYGYLLDIDLYFKGNDEETLKIVRDLKKAIDNYVKNPSKDNIEKVSLENKKFYDAKGELKSKYTNVSTYINNLDEMIFRTKQRLYFKK